MYQRLIALNPPFLTLASSCMCGLPITEKESLLTWVIVDLILTLTFQRNWAAKTRCQIDSKHIKFNCCPVWQKSVFSVKFGVLKLITSLLRPFDHLLLFYFVTVPSDAVRLVFPTWLFFSLNFCNLFEEHCSFLFSFNIYFVIGQFSKEL